jgi:hypothetical protein
VLNITRTLYELSQFSTVKLKSSEALPIIQVVSPREIIPIAMMNTTSMIIKITPNDPILKKIAKSFLLQIITKATNRNSETYEIDQCLNVGSRDSTI